MPKTFKIQIKGQVQGVGFRPFVFNLAHKQNIKGSVSNDPDGVIIYCTSTKDNAIHFLNSIVHQKPEVAEITKHSITEVDDLNFSDFTIKISNKATKIDLPLTPDFAICNLCKTEIHSKENRRNNYPFTTCVNCGPRYAITKSFPFERNNTSMLDFEMCSTCSNEYKSPTDRRFHSQTNSCPSCGIKLKLVSNKGKIVAHKYDDAIEGTVHYLRNGNIIAIKNTNGYILCCDATNSKAVWSLRHLKNRKNKPFAVLYPSIEALSKEFNMSSYESEALQSRVAPIVILQNSNRLNIATSAIAPHIDQTGVMLPSSALLEIIMSKINSPIIATSGNMKGSPIISEEIKAEKLLASVADYFLHHNLGIEFPQDDSVVRFADKEQIILRRSRGLAPNYIASKIRHLKPMLAMGAYLKSTFSFIPNSQLYVSQYFGNLENYEVLERYKSTLKTYFKLFENHPQHLIVDKHSQYQSSLFGQELALKYNTEVIQVQHHKAHFASVLGEHDLFASKESILGVIWDGTGLGEDQQIWGGEFFVYDDYKIERISHFEYFDWLANDKMAKEPRLSLFSLWEEDNKHLIKSKFSNEEWMVYSTLKTRNKLKTSSVGRLFDAVASLLNISDVNSYEAEASIRLEDCAIKHKKEDHIDFLEGEFFENVPSKLLIYNISKALIQGIKKERLACSLLYTLARLIIRTAKTKGINTIACSGGVFQNSLLIHMIKEFAIKEEINLKLNRNLSPNDENISFGQLMYSQNIKN